MLPANSVRRTDGYLLTVPVTRIVKERVSLPLHNNLHRCCVAATLEDSIWSYSTFQMHIQESSQCPVNKHSQHKSKASVFPVKCSLKEWTNKMHNYCRRTHTHLMTVLASRHWKYRFSKIPVSLWLNVNPNVSVKRMPGFSREENTKCLSWATVQVNKSSAC